MFISKKCRNLVKKPSMYVSTKENAFCEETISEVKIEEIKPKKKPNVKPVESENTIVAENKEDKKL